MTKLDTIADVCFSADHTMVVLLSAPKSRRVEDCAGAGSTSLQTPRSRHGDGESTHRPLSSLQSELNKSPLFTLKIGLKC